MGEADTRRAALQSLMGLGLCASLPLAHAQRQPLTLRVGWGNSPPYQIPSPGPESDRRDPTGLDIELITLWARAAKVNVEWVRATWARQLLEVQAGTLDVMMSATPSAERRVYADFTESYRHEHLGLVALAGRGLEIKSLQELEGRDVKVGVMRGSAYPPELAEALARPGLQQTLVPMRGDDLTLAALRAGRLTYILGDTISIGAHAAKEPGTPITVALAFKGEPVHLLVGRHLLAATPDLMTRLDTALTRVRASTAWAKALARYPSTLSPRKALKPQKPAAAPETALASK